MQRRSYRCRTCLRARFRSLCCRSWCLNRYWCWLRRHYQAAGDGCNRSARAAGDAGAARGGRPRPRGRRTRRVVELTDRRVRDGAVLRHADRGVPRARAGDRRRLTADDRGDLAAGLDRDVAGRARDADDLRSARTRYQEPFGSANGDLRGCRRELIVRLTARWVADVEVQRPVVQNDLVLLPGVGCAERADLHAGLFADVDLRRVGKPQNGLCARLCYRDGTIGKIEASEDRLERSVGLGLVPDDPLNARQLLIAAGGVESNGRRTKGE